MNAAGEHPPHPAPAVDSPDARPDPRRTILILAPLRNDGPLTAQFLAHAGLRARVCADMRDLCARADESCGALLLAEETLDEGAVARLSATLSAHPPWSDLPIVIITSGGGEASPERRRRLTAFGPTGNVALIERPFRPGTLVNAMEVALRSRQRQFEVRDLLERVRRDAEVLRHGEERYRHLAEDTARQSRIYQTTLSSTPDFLYVFDLEGRCRFVNRALLSLWNLPAGDVVGRTLHDLKSPFLPADRLQAHIQHVIRTGQPVRDETPYTSAAGARAYETIFSPVFGADGSVEAVAGSTRDITERRDAERVLQAQAAALRDADRRKDEFLAMLAHELRNPLSSIGNAINLLKDERGAGDRAWATEVISRQTRQLARLVDDLLDVSRITRGKIELRRELLDAAGCLESACEAVAPLIAERGHTLRATIPHGELWLHADPTRLEQILVNLLANAAKYSEPHGLITLTAQHSADGIVVEVRDTGIGIAPEKLPAMFELFAQGERTIARSEGGLGIGLTIVRALCEMHGGSISAASAGLGQGSTFTVRLPAADRAAHPAPTNAPAPAAPRDDGLRVLVVDDNVDTATGVSRLLSLRGYLVRVAHDGPAALEAALAFHPAVVLLDIGLPGMDGYEVTRRLRATAAGAEVFIVALSGYGQEEDRRLSREAGFDHHLVKPVDFEEVHHLLAAHPHQIPSSSSSSSS